MALPTEKKRGCGWKKVGGLYLIGGIMNAPCDRLPITLTTCPTCGEGLKVGKGFTKINPFKMWGNHGMEFKQDIQEAVDCHDQPTCYVCNPLDGIGYLMRVGEKFYTPENFMAEARQMGVSKRIPFIPRELRVGVTPIFLVHKKAGWRYDEVPDGKGRQKRVVVPTDAVFAAFIPMRIEQLVWKKDLKGKKGKELRESLEKRGITIVEVPDNDRDHRPNKERKK